MSAEKSAERDLRKRNGSTDPGVQEEDAAAFARVAMKHYGNEAPGVLSRAVEIATSQVDKWAGKAVAL